MNENWKFSDIPYTRPDVEALQARYDALTRRARDAAGPEELLRVVRDRDALQQEVSLCQSIATIRAFHDVTDAFYQTEFQETLPRLEGSLDSQSLAQAIVESPYAQAVDEAFGPQLRRLLTLDKPLVLDADGINVLEGHIDVLRGAACPVVLTPHDGEYRRLMGRLPGEDRMGAAAALAEKTGATVLLKGHRTAICGADERWENRCGNPGLATGGSGDVLAGILVSLLGQGLPPVHAAAAAAWLHGTAADRCAARMGEYGLLPSDVAAELPYLLP